MAISRNPLVEAIQEDILKYLHPHTYTAKILCQINAILLVNSIKTAIELEQACSYHKNMRDTFQLPQLHQLFKEGGENAS